MKLLDKRFLSNWHSLIPLLAFYLIFITITSNKELGGDELRHMAYATNLSNGFYTDINNPSIRNGPGYPIVIWATLFFTSSTLVAKLMNAFFLFGAVVFFYKSLRMYVYHKKAMIISIIFGLYPPTLKFISGLFSEPMALFLVCGFLLFFLKLHQSNSKKRKHIILTAFFLGILALTKFIFSYVILAIIIPYLLFLIIKKSNQAKHTILVLIGGFMFCLPYLGYTYSVTNKKFLFGTQGGEMLYWRSTPFDNEYGNWFSIESVLDANEYKEFDRSKLSENHIEFIENLVPYSYLKRDSIYKQKAIENIKKHPEKYLKNTGVSALRLFFNYPYSYSPQKPTSFFYILPNMILMFLIIVTFYIGLKKWKFISFDITFLFLFALIFMGGLTLLDGRVRHLIPIIPILLVLITAIFSQFVQLKIRES